jgi:hypothetical protein
MPERRFPPPWSVNEADPDWIGGALSSGMLMDRRSRSQSHSSPALPGAIPGAGSANNLLCPPMGRFCPHLLPIALIQHHCM